jgi:soluble lytic murein transglycosylase-like protein
VWGFPVDELKADLRQGDYTRIAGAEVRNPYEALSLTPQAPFYLAFIFDSLGRTEQALLMRELAWSESPRPWKEEAGTLLARDLLAQKSYARAEAVARSLLALPDLRGGSARARRMLVEALYWEHRDEEALREIERLGVPDPEVLLFAAVSSLRLERPTGRDFLLQLFFRERVSALHGRALAFLESDPPLFERFSAAEKSLLAAKGHFALGEWAKGVPLMESALAKVEPDRLAGSVLIADLGNAYLLAGLQAAGARFMEKLSSRLAGGQRADALEQAGRLARKAKEYSKSLALLRAALADSGNAGQADRIRWFILSILLARNPGAFDAQLGRDSPAWSDSEYFSDLIEDRIAELAKARDWRTLGGLWKALEAYGPREAKAQIAYMLARAKQEGFTGGLPGEPPAAAADFFRLAVRESPKSYFGTMAACALGEMPERTRPRSSEESAKDPVPALDPFILGFLPFGLADRAFEGFWAQREKLSDAALAEAARQLSLVGDHRNSMYLMAALARRRPLDQAELLLLYPRPFGPLIPDLARGAGIAEHVLYGIIREESFFDPAVVSSAGAVGLSQLMPSTAAQVAAKLDMKDPDLKDPATNLALGVRHLRDLIAGMGSLPKALLAYNAGRARLRSWEKAGGGLPLDLFLETVPFGEPREYVRKILVSSVMYASLYGGGDPRETARAFFSLGR